MSILFAIALTTGLLSGLWGWVAVSLGLLSWAGFLGCTTYFASPVQGIKGLLLSMLTNMTGVFWAMVIIKGSQWAHFEILGYDQTGSFHIFGHNFTRPPSTLRFICFSWASCITINHVPRTVKLRMYEATETNSVYTTIIQEYN